jgi:hypothetical protein
MSYFAPGDLLPPSANTHERSNEEGWHEWSLDLGTEKDVDFKPRRLFVRIDDNSGIITVTDARVTSGNATARELDGDKTKRELLVGIDEAPWLIETLVRATAQIQGRGTTTDLPAPPQIIDLFEALKNSLKVKP